MLTSGNVYVIDAGNHRIQKFTSDGEFITKWGSEGSGEGQFSNANGIAVDGEGNVYVTDGSNRTKPNYFRVQKFSDKGKFICKWGGKSGQGKHEYIWPEGLDVDRNGFVYVADMNNHRVQKFEGKKGFLSKWSSWGTQGNGNGQFSYPNDIAVDSSDNVFVLDGSNHRVQKFTSNGALLAMWGAPRNYPSSLVYPTCIAVDTNGNVLITKGGDSFIEGKGWAPRIMKFSGNGELIAYWGSKGSGTGQFSSIEGIAVDAADNIYVSDSAKYDEQTNHRIQKFTSNGEFISTWVL